MGPLVDLLGGGANSFHANAPVNKWTADMSQLQTNNYAPYMGDALAANRGIQEQEGALASMLSAQAAGGGPNPALEQLKQTTSQNINNAAGQVASQRGINPALAARLALDAGAGANQQAAGQAATMRAQQQLGAQQQLASLLGQQGAQNAAQLNTVGGLQGQQNQQNIALQGLGQQTQAQNAGLELGAQQLNAGVASQNTQVGQGILGGVLGGAGAVLGLAGGGQIRGYDEGGDVGAQPDGSSPLHLYMQGLDTSYLKPAAPSIGPGQLQKPPGFEFGSGSNPLSSGMQLSSPTLGIGPQQFDPAAIMREKTAAADAKSAALKKVGQGFSNLGQGVSQDSTGAFNRFAGMRLAGSMYADGGSIFANDGNVPGKAEVRGDSEENDKVPAMLSPGEIVIPRSIAQAPDAPAKAHDFVAHLVQRSGSGYGRVLKARGYAEGGSAEKEPTTAAPPVQPKGEESKAGQSVVDRIRAWMESQHRPAINRNEKTLLDQEDSRNARDYSAGGIVEPKTSTARGVGGARHRGRIKKADKPGFVPLEAD